MKLLSVENVFIGYTYDIVRNVSFDLNEGEIVAIVGESGSGKSTLLKSIVGKFPGSGTVSKGHIFYRNKDINSMEKKELSAIRGNDISMIFQSPGAALNPVRKIRSHFIETICNHTNFSKQEAYEKGISILKKLNLHNPEEIMNGYSFQLSGGMKQRVSIALALALAPKILLADEPTSALDATVQRTVVEELRRLHQELGTAIILVTHNILLSAYIADRIAVMYAGEIVEIGSKDSIMTNPKHPYTKALIDAIPQIDKTKSLKGIKGRRVDLSNIPSGCSFANRCDAKCELCLQKHPELQCVGKDHFAACNCIDRGE